MADHEHSPPQFSDPAFNDQVAMHEREAGASRSERRGHTEMVANVSHHFEEDRENLITIADEVAEAAVEAGLESVPIYALRDKGTARRLMNNRAPKDLVEATQGWVIVPPTSDFIKKSPGKANLTDDSGLGLILTRDGKLYGGMSWKGLKPVGERLTKIKRTKIQRKTFVYKEKDRWYQPTIAKDTFLPRYRAMEDEGAPTLIGDLSNPEGGLDSAYFTPYVIEQCYDALARFVQENDLASGGNGGTSGGTETRPTPHAPEPPTEVLEKDAPSGKGSGKQPRLRKVETLSDQEKIDQWIQEGLITMRAWLGPNNLSHWHNPAGVQNELATVFNEVDRARAVAEDIEGPGASTPDTIQRELENNGVDEVVTISFLDKKFGEINKDSARAEENVARITYEVPPADGGNRVRMHLFLPGSEAKEAFERMYANPSLIRKVSDTFMSDYLGVGKSWGRAGPDYVRLKAKNNGRSHMAFRRSFIDRPTEGHIREV